MRLVDVRVKADGRYILSYHIPGRKKRWWLKGTKDRFKRYIGSCTVWNHFPSFVRCSTMDEVWLSDEWDRMEYFGIKDVLKDNETKSDDLNLAIGKDGRTILTNSKGEESKYKYGDYIKCSECPVWFIRQPSIIDRSHWDDDKCAYCN